MRYAVINTSVAPTYINDQKHLPVANVIEYDGDQYTPDGLLVQSDTAGTGQLYNFSTGQFIDDPNAIEGTNE